MPTPPRHGRTTHETGDEEVSGTKWPTSLLHLIDNKTLRRLASTSSVPTRKREMYEKYVKERPSAPAARGLVPRNLAPRRADRDLQN